MRRLGGLTSLALLGLLAAAPSAFGDVFKPTRFDDPPPGRCLDNDCSLREAIRKANNKAGADRVVLSEGVYKMQLAGDGGIDVGDFNVSGPVTIRGRGARETRVDGDGLDRVFTADGERVTFKDLAIQGGDSGANPFHTSVGGGLTALGDRVVVENVLITRNEAQYGGGIRSTAGDLEIVNSTISRNDANEGGGIDLRGAAGATPETRISASTISLNHADYKGAGMLADGLGGSGSFVPLVILENSTVALNVAVDPLNNAGTRQGGGIMADNQTNVVLDNTTVAMNRAGDVVENGTGGGVYQHSNAVFILGDSILAQNAAAQSGTVGLGVAGSQCAGAFQSSGGVVVENHPGLGTTTCSINGTYLFPDNAETEGLAANGGPTKTVAIAPPSVAIGYAVSCPATDQRGVARPATGCDSGAFEAP